MRSRISLDGQWNFLTKVDGDSALISVPSPWQADARCRGDEPPLTAVAEASQHLQYDALKHEIEQIRRYESIQGYVITEFPDVHWECNGLLESKDLLQIELPIYSVVMIGES